MHSEFKIIARARSRAAAVTDVRRLGIFVGAQRNHAEHFSPGERAEKSDHRTVQLYTAETRFSLSLSLLQTRASIAHTHIQRTRYKIRGVKTRCRDATYSIYIELPPARSKGSCISQRRSSRKSMTASICIRGSIYMYMDLYIRVCTIRRDTAVPCL